MEPSHAERLARVRAEMRAQGLDYLIVRGTDRYLNEYVPTDESTRVWLTGFTGSTGDALVGLDGAWVFVDGRYWVQADRELDATLWQVVRVPLGTGVEAAVTAKVLELGGPKGATVGYECDRLALKTLDDLTAKVAAGGVKLAALARSPVEVARGDVRPSAGTVRAVDERSAGRTVAEKVAEVARWLDQNRCEALVLQKLDEVAWVTNLRGDELPYQATFRAVAAVTRAEVLLAVHVADVPAAVRAARPGVRWTTPDALVAELAALAKPARLAGDPTSTTVAFRDAVRAAGAELVALPSPIAPLKAKKTPAELAAMRAAFGRADGVVAEAQRWLNERVAGGAKVSEVDFAREVEALFRRAGAVGLSFKVISAFGVNGADVHHPPDEDALVREGDLMLLDTGCYFEEGFATDLTRTFFVGRPGVAPTPEQKKLFTLTLKAAIAGMSARIPKNATGAQLDGITRAPLWAAGYDYAHGTGHGVGINVHEAPPRIANTSTLPVEEGHVFSIEPGLYLEGVGGVRIENLCTVVPDPEHPGFLRVEPLTFSPLDARLIEEDLLDARELDFLRRYAGAGNG